MKWITKAPRRSTSCPSVPTLAASCGRRASSSTVSHCKASLRLDSVGTMPHACTTTGPRHCKVHVCKGRHARRAPRERGSCSNCQRGVRCSIMVHYRNIAEPLQCFIGRGRLHKHEGNCRLAAVEGFNFKLICFRVDLWVSQKAATLPSTRGPVATERLLLGNGFMPLPDLGSPMARHSNDNPTR
jgi:hypothetical protein